MAKDFEDCSSMSLQTLMRLVILPFTFTCLPIFALYVYHFRMFRRRYSAKRESCTLEDNKKSDIDLRMTISSDFRSYSAADSDFQVDASEPLVSDNRATARLPGSVEAKPAEENSLIKDPYAKSNKSSSLCDDSTR